MSARIHASFEQHWCLATLGILPSTLTTGMASTGGTGNVGKFGGGVELGGGSLG